MAEIWRIFKCNSKNKSTYIPALPFHTHSSLPSTWMHQIMRANWIQLSGSCVDGYWVCAPLGRLLRPLGRPQATNWIIRVHESGLTHLTGQRRARRFALTLRCLMFDSLSLPLPTWMSDNWDSAGAWHYVCRLSLYVFFFFWSIGYGLQRCFWG